MPGALYIIATPIGHLKDITLRAVETLQVVDAVACEDTRWTEKLMRHLNIQKPLLRYDEFTHGTSQKKIIDLINQGKSVGIVTDAGTPGISDPGTRLVQGAVEAGIKVIPIPGASAAITALSASGMGATGFLFLGFLPRRPGRARRVLQEALGLGRTVVLYESPYRVIHTLEDVAKLSPEAPVVVGRELTKIHEEFTRGPVADVLDRLKGREILGEVTIIIGAAEKVREDTEP